MTDAFASNGQIPTAGRANAAHVPVAIVGAGPCGLYASVLLSQMGIEHLLIEKHPGISFHPKAMGMTRRTGELMRQAGLLDAMLASDWTTGATALSLWLKGFDDQVISEIPMADYQSPHTPCHPFHCPQTHTEKVLMQAVQASGLASVCFDHHLDAFKQDDGGVTLEVTDRGSNRTRSWHCDYLLAADGAASGVRDALGIETDGPGEMGRFCNVYFEADYEPWLGRDRAILLQVLREDGFGFFVSVNGHDQWLMHHFLQPGEKPEDFDHDRFTRIIQFLTGLPDVPVRILGVSPWAMNPRMARQLRSDRVLLTGDAAARLSPAGGLGLNTGLQSVHNLIWKLALVVRGRAGQGLLDTYATERLAAAQLTMDNSGANAGEIFQIISAAMEGKWDLAVDRIHHSRRKGAGLGQDLGLVYPEGGALVSDGTSVRQPEDLVNDYLPQAVPGCRAPHLTGRYQGDAVSLLDFFGEHFVLLHHPAAATWTDAVKGHPLSDARQGPGLTSLAVAAQGNGDDGWIDTENRFADLYEVDTTGAVLVRPDGYVAARTRQAPADPGRWLTATLQTILQ